MNTFLHPQGRRDVNVNGNLKRSSLSSGDINWDSKAVAFCFGLDFLYHYFSERMVVVGNKFEKDE